MQAEVAAPLPAPLAMTHAPVRRSAASGVTGIPLPQVCPVLCPAGDGRAAPEAAGHKAPVPAGRGAVITSGVPWGLGTLYAAWHSPVHWKCMEPYDM